MIVTGSALRDTETKAKIAAEAACLLRPSAPVSPLVWEIGDTGASKDEPRHVGVLPPERHEGAAQMLRQMGFVWTVSIWAKKCTDETVDDLIVEVAVGLLALGLVVRVPRPELVERVVSGDYEPVCMRHVKVLSGGRRFILTWPSEKDNGLYDALKRVPGARWDRALRGVTLPKEMYNEMLDFAEANGFQISEEAQRLAAEAEAVYKATVIVDVQPRELEPPARRGIGEIDAELRDDD